VEQHHGQQRVDLAALREAPGQEQAQADGFLAQVLAHSARDNWARRDRTDRRLILCYAGLLRLVAWNSVPPLEQALMLAPAQAAVLAWCDAEVGGGQAGISRAAVCEVVAAVPASDGLVVTTCGRFRVYHLAQSGSDWEYQHIVVAETTFAPGAAVVRQREIARASLFVSERDADDYDDEGVARSVVQRLILREKIVLPETDEAVEARIREALLVELVRTEAGRGPVCDLAISPDGQHALALHGGDHSGRSPSPFAATLIHPDGVAHAATAWGKPAFTLDDGRAVVIQEDGEEVRALLIDDQRVIGVSVLARGGLTLEGCVRVDLQRIVACVQDRDDGHGYSEPVYTTLWRCLDLTSGLVSEQQLGIRRLYRGPGRPLVTANQSAPVVLPELPFRREWPLALGRDYFLTDLRLTSVRDLEKYLVAPTGGALQDLSVDELIAVAITGDGALELWHVLGGRRLARLEGGSDPYLCARFAGEHSSQLVAGSESGRVVRFRVERYLSIQRPFARSVREMQFVASLEPCACGAATGALDVLGGAMAWSLVGDCEQCGAPRAFAFRTEGTPYEAVVPRRELGDARSSRVISPEQFLGELERQRPKIGDAPQDLQPEAWRLSAAAVDRSLTCLLELLKFSPAELEAAIKLGELGAATARLEAQRDALLTLAARYTEDAPRIRKLDEEQGEPYVPMLREELDGDRLREHAAWLARGELGEGRISLVDLDASEVKLPFIELSRVRLERVRLNEADLSSSKLVGAELIDVVLDAAELGYSDWSNARVSGARFAGANLFGARLDGAVFKRCDFRGADLSRGCGVEGMFAAAQALASNTGLRFEDCDLRETRWEGRDLSTVAFIGCRFSPPGEAS